MSSPMHVVVIGAGLGGLSSAAYLSRSGHNVTLLERDRDLLRTLLTHPSDQELVMVQEFYLISRMLAPGFTPIYGR